MGEDSHFFTLNLYFARFGVDSQPKWCNLTTFHTSRNLFWGCLPFSWLFSCREDRGQMWMPRWRCWNIRSSWWSERTRRSCHPSEDSKCGPEKWKWYRIIEGTFSFFKLGKTFSFLWIFSCWTKGLFPSWKPSLLIREFIKWTAIFPKFFKF